MKNEDREDMWKLGEEIILLCKKTNLSAPQLLGVLETCKMVIVSDPKTKMELYHEAMK